MSQIKRQADVAKLQTRSSSIYASDPWMQQQNARNLEAAERGREWRDKTQQVGLAGLAKFQLVPAAVLEGQAAARIAQGADTKAESSTLTPPQNSEINTAGNMKGKQ